MITGNKFFGCGYEVFEHVESWFVVVRYVYIEMQGFMQGALGFEDLEFEPEQL